ncbi:S8 family peptidase [Streptomyces gossypii]|uniref:S8 family peptidase n=1 Tax=Streptomyces gossypii TaxID=2883101 RepID=UPI002882E0D3|nr:S8 family peptidase [Streptomyces gossypii]
MYQRTRAPARRQLAAKCALVATTVTAMLVAATGAATADPTPADPAPAAEKGGIAEAASPDRIDGSYLVTLKGDPSVASAAKRLASEHGGEITHTYSAALHGFALRTDEASARELAADPAVARVEADQRMQALGTQPNPPSWGLDRVDQAQLPLDDSYTYPDSSSNVHAYIIDTGIRVTHEDFGGRATWGTNTVDSNNTDCNGHGTHVAGTTGGTDYGVAKSPQLVAVKVLNCQGSGSTAGVVAGIDWVTANAVKPAVSNMSLGGGSSPTLDSAVRRSIGTGISYAVAAGNERENACTGSPSGVAEAITVGATTRNDSRSSFSDFGQCLDLFAPGSDITSAWSTSDTAQNTISGTSMASPHVAGAAALVAGANPGWTPQQIRDYLVENSTAGVVGNPGTGSPNRLLRVINDGGGDPDPDNDFALEADPAARTVEAGQPATTKVLTSVAKGDAESIRLTASGLPSGVEAAFDPSSVTAGESSGLTLSTSAGTPSGTHTVTITGTSASGEHSVTFALTVTGGGSDECVNPGQKLSNPGFESGAASWNASANVIGQWQSSGQAPRTGSWNAWLNGYGSTNTNTLQQGVSLPANCSQYTLGFYLHTDTDEAPGTPYDTLAVQVLDESGSNVLGTLRTYSNEDADSGYAKQSLNLGEYAGRDIQIRFVGKEDAYLQTSFVIDDTTVDVS